MPTDEQLESLAAAIKDDLKFVYRNDPIEGAEDRLITLMVDTIKNIEIVEALELPPIKIHCSVLAEDSIKQAIEDYESKQ